MEEFRSLTIGALLQRGFHQSVGTTGRGHHFATDVKMKRASADFVDVRMDVHRFLDTSNTDFGIPDVDKTQVNATEHSCSLSHCYRAWLSSDHRSELALPIVSSATATEHGCSLILTVIRQS